MSNSRPRPHSTPPTFVKFREDRWNTSPPQVTSYLEYSNPEGDSRRTTRDKSPTGSPTCGFGWRFVIEDSRLIFQRHNCSSTLSDVVINVKVSYPGGNTKPAEGTYTCSFVKSESKIGTYPLQQGGSARFEITLTFNTSDDLSLPTTFESHLKAFRYSLDEPSFADTKFYLFSARVRGRPAVPKAVFARSQLLINSSTYLRNREPP